MPTVGTNVRRKEGLAKLTGEALYVADLEVPGAWWGLTIRSPHAHARLVSIKKEPGFEREGALLVTAEDMRTRGWDNVVQPIVDDQPFLAEGIVQHPEEPVALVVAPTREAAEAAARR